MRSVFFIPTAHCRARLAVALAMFWASQGSAAPAGGNVQQGEAQISSGTHTQVLQSTQEAEIHWSSFDIGLDESVTFHVPDSSSYTLNQIHDFKPSEIYGNLTSNGTVILANPNGLYFGASASVNVNALVATSAQVTLDGQQLSLTPSGRPAAIEHWGDISAGETLAFFAPRVEIGGSIEAPNIEISNHSTGVVTLADSGIGFLVDDAAADRLEQNGIRISGELRAEGGYIGLSTSALDTLADSALNMEGLVSASSVESNAGQVALRSDAGTTWITGQIDASSVNGSGGEISLQGHQIGVVGQASVQSDGATGGGRIDIGTGDETGAGRSSQVYAGIDTRISANATANGDGGAIELWSTDVTQAHGRIEAKGVGEGSQGGFVETSSEQQLIANADVDISAEGGHAGTWLLDPGDIIIGDILENNIDDTTPNVFTTDNDNLDSFLPVSSIIGTLNSASGATVTVMTTGTDSDIHLVNELDLDGLPLNSSLTFQAVRDIHLHDNIVGGMGNNFTLSLDAGSTIRTDNLSTSIEVANLNLDAASVISNQALDITAINVLMQDGLIWTANSDVSFDRNSNINTLAVISDSSLTFSMNDHNLTLGSVGQFGGSRLNQLTITKTNDLTLSNELRLGDADLDLNSGVSRILLDGNSIAINTQGDLISLANVEGAGGNNLNINNGVNPAGTVELNNVTQVNNLVVETSESVILNSGQITVGNLLQLSSDRVDLSNGTHSLTAAGNLTVTGDFEGHPGGDTLLLLDANNLQVQNFGVNQGLRDLTLEANNTIGFAGETLNAELLYVDANTLSLSENTTFTVAETAEFNGTLVTTENDESLSIEATDQLVLSEVEVGSLALVSNDLQLDGNLMTIDGDMDLSGISQLTLLRNIALESGGTGALTLPNNIAGGFGLDLTVHSGALNLGEQNQVAPLAYLTLIDLNPNLGQNSLGGDLRVVNTLDLSQAGSLNFAPDNPAATALTLTSDSGDVRFDDSTLNVDGRALMVSADNGIAWVGSVESADTISITTQEMRLGGALEAVGAINLGLAGALNLIEDSQLTGQLSLGTTNDNIAINGPHSLAINNLGHSLTLYEVGANQALSSLSVSQVDTLRLTQPLNTQGVDGVTLAGNQWLLTEDAQINTAGANGAIDLSGIGVNGPHTLTLNAGDGTVSLGDIGQSGKLASLILQQASALQLGGDISTDSERLDFSVVQAIELIADTRIDSSEQDGIIDLGTGSIDGTFDLTLNSGEGAITLGAVGQNTALQSLLLETTTELELDQSISVVDQLQVNAGRLAIDGQLTSSGGRIVALAAEGIAMGAGAQINGYEGIRLETTSGDVGLGYLASDQGGIEITATEGSIVNAIGDFVTLKDTSVNLRADEVQLNAGAGIGTGPRDPVVLDVATDGIIALEFTEPVAYIVNINGTNLDTTSDGNVFDVLLASQQAGNRLSAQGLVSGSPWVLSLINESVMQTPDSLLFAVTQPGFQIPSNVLLADDAISEQRPVVPGLLFDGQSWRLAYPLRSDVPGRP
ncbi:MAG: two-partner secretion domain-containing protein [Saccharospirillum sp.]